MFMKWMVGRACLGGGRMARSFAVKLTCEPPSGTAPMFMNVSEYARSSMLEELGRILAAR